jgi:coenzyme F420-reducing hydrogenase beta subunit
MGNIRKYKVFMMGLGCNLKKLRKIKSILMGKMDPHMADRILHLLGIACT